MGGGVQANLSLPENLVARIVLKLEEKIISTGVRAIAPVVEIGRRMVVWRGEGTLRGAPVFLRPVSGTVGEAREGAQGLRQPTA